MSLEDQMGVNNSHLARVKEAALEVLLNNLQGPFQSLPRTAGFGYPEPYTRDLMICALGSLVSGDEALITSLRDVLQALAQNQSDKGHIPSLVHAPHDRGASDTTPLFLIGLALYRQAAGAADFLDEAACKALEWMAYQSPDDQVLIAQQPTTDWRDEQWVLGYGLYVNTLVYIYLLFYGLYDRAAEMRDMFQHKDERKSQAGWVVHEGLVIPKKPYYALWSFKAFNSERFDLLGNSLAILSGLASPARSKNIVAWVEAECKRLQSAGELALELPPCLIPFIQPGDEDWHSRYEHFNLPGEYHNGGVWPFICGFYIAALVAVGRRRLAEMKLASLAELMMRSRQPDLPYGFNEWFRAQDGMPCGQDWQSWSAAMFLYAADCVEQGRTPFFQQIREANWPSNGT